jgi:hypothetical protein
MAHAKYSPSAADRWLSCPGSIALGLKAPPQPPSKYSEEGTKAHTCLEMFLKNGLDKWEKTKKFLLKTHDKDMVEHAHFAAETIWAHKPDHAELLCETKVKLDFISKDLSGTVDCAIVELCGVLTVIDFKYGAGYEVEVEENPQLICYALGAAHLYDYDFERVDLMIIQPRIEGDAVKRHSMSIDHLKDWGKKFEAAIKACEKDDAPLMSGSHCKWCPAKTICPEISDKSLKQAQIDFAPIANGENMNEPSFPLPSTLTAPMLSKVLDAVPKIETWIEAVKDHAFNELKNGVKITGFKLVAKRGTRKWVNPEITETEAAKNFGEAAFTTPEIKSPAQLEKIAGKEWVNARAVSVSSGETLVAENDPRPAIAHTTIEEDFSTPPEMVSEVEWKGKTKKRKTK